MGIGDEVLVTGQVRELQRTDPRKVRIHYEGRRRWYSVWDNNPRIATSSEKGDFNEWCPRVHGLRPYCSLKGKDHWEWKPYRPPVGEFYFTETEIQFAKQHEPRVILGTDVKPGASPNKQWGRERWVRLGRRLVEAGIPFCQIGPFAVDPIPGGAFVSTVTIRDAAVLIAHSPAVICHEGALHHIAAAVNTPAVTINGGYVSPEVTGYDGQEALFAGGGLGCGMRVPCQHCQEAMAAIRPDMVMESLLRVIERKHGLEHID